MGKPKPVLDTLVTIKELDVWLVIVELIIATFVINFVINM